LRVRAEIDMQKDVNKKTRDEELAKQKLDMELDRELEATFPASDALKITRRQTDTSSNLNRGREALR
jgi:hypothetical protein